MNAIRIHGAYGRNSQRIILRPIKYNKMNLQVKQ